MTFKVHRKHSSGHIPLGPGCNFSTWGLTIKLLACSDRICIRTQYEWFEQEMGTGKLLLALLKIEESPAQTQRMCKGPPGPMKMLRVGCAFWVVSSPRLRYFCRFLYLSILLFESSVFNPCFRKSCLSSHGKVRAPSAWSAWSACSYIHV